jgi:hypothetical protein
MCRFANLAVGQVDEYGRHLRQMETHRVLGAVTIAIVDRGHDRSVLSERTDRPAGREDRAELKAHHLGTQSAAHVDRDAMAR